MQAAEDSHEELMKNRNAESAFARKALWDEASDSKVKKGADRMRQTILGDNISTGTDIAKLALGLGIMATGIGLPVGGYFVAEGLKNMKPDVVNNVTKDAKDTDTIIELDLPE